MSQVGEIEARLIRWAQRRGHLLLRASFALVFVWFGVAKFVGTSPTEDLVGGVVPFLPPEVFIVLLGVLQAVIGLCFVFRRLLKPALLLFFLHLPGTLLPLAFQPEATFDQFPFHPTLEGQFILKNLILGSAALILLGTLSPTQRPD